MKKLLVIFFLLLAKNILTQDAQLLKKTFNIAETQITTKEGIETKYEVIRPELFNIFKTDFLTLYPAQVISLEANRILANLKQSYYEHTTTVDEYNGICNLDCSGLVAYILRYSLNDHYEKINEAKTVGQARPLATDFYSFFNSSPNISDPEQNPTGWMIVNYLRNIKPGDIISWDYKDDTLDNTGHVIIVQTITTKFKTSVTIDEKQYWEYKIKVIDSSSGTHYQDSRDLPKNLTGEGVGSGNMYFGVNSEGKIQYYKWSSRRNTPRFENFAIGRAIPFPLK